MSEIPAHIQPYVDAIGTKAGAIELFLALGGSAIYLAERPQRRSALVAAVGIDAAKALARHFGPRHVDVPIPKVWMAHEMRLSGVSVNEIARRLHVSQVTARSYLRKQVIPRKQKSSPASRQMALDL